MAESDGNSSVVPLVDDSDPKRWNSFSKSGLTFNRMLGSFVNGRQIACLCQSSSSTEENQQAVVILEKLPISETDINDLLACKAGEPDSTSLILANDIYYTFHVNPHVSSKLNTMKATVVKPATEQHISKYSFSEAAVITETPELYNAVTKPYIVERQLALRWVDNILNGTAEAERVLYSDDGPLNGFVLLPDMKWDGINDPKRRLYLVAICRRKDVFSIRDLTAEHLHLLEHIATVVPKFIHQRYGIPLDHLRIFFHYLPSYWHLHVHFVVGAFDGQDSGGMGGLWSADRAHFLSSVIANIRLLSDYYQRATLVYSLRTDNQLYVRHAAYLSSKVMPVEKKNNGFDIDASDQPESKMGRFDS